jgi:LysM repeat protein
MKNTTRKQMNPARLLPQPQALECADGSALWADDLSPSNTKGGMSVWVRLLNAARLWRQVANAGKAVTSHRTPNLCRRRGTLQAGGRKLRFALLAIAVIVPLAVWAQSQKLSVQTAPPVVVKTVPVAGATDVDPALTEIKVTYSKAMQDGSWSWSTWGEENFPETTGGPKYLQDGRTCVLPVKLQPDKFYAIWLNSDTFKNFTDASGRPAVPYLLTFFTGNSASRASETSAMPKGVVKIYAYKAQAGDTMSRIVNAFRAKGKVNMDDILKANPGLNPAKLRVGEEIIIPVMSSNVSAPAQAGWDANLNDDQRAVAAWTDRQFRSFFDERTFARWSEEDRAALETKLIDALKGPRSREYYQAINTLAALRSTKALPALREIAYDRHEKDNRDRWMAIRAIGMIGDKSDVPELIPLVYHGNSNTRWWAQISLVRLTGQNFGKDWNAWGKWWNDDQNGQPPYKTEIIRWWSGQPDSGKLAGSLEESDQKFLRRLQPKAAATADKTQY